MMNGVSDDSRPLRILPTNSLTSPMLTDMYQITMAYAYWVNGRKDEPAVFDLFFRKCPFSGEFCVFAGLDEVLKLLSSFEFSQDHVEYLQSIMPLCDPDFFVWLRTLNCSNIKVYAMEEGSVGSLSFISIDY